MNTGGDSLAAVRVWVDSAEGDLTHAEHALGVPDSKCPFNTVCFHAQQCAEKYLKAGLIQRGWTRLEHTTSLSLPPSSPLLSARL